MIPIPAGASSPINLWMSVCDAVGTTPNWCMTRGEGLAWKSRRLIQGRRGYPERESTPATISVTGKGESGDVFNIGAVVSGRRICKEGTLNKIGGNLTRVAASAV